jgi:flavin reductase (DIM6/NTAB) family NADH-FMN oxidoreductase RutF
MTKKNNEALRKAFSMFSTGITIVTAIDKDKNPIGMTVNSFSSVSLDPPLVLWSIGKKQPSYESFLDAKGYAVNILSNKQIKLCNHFASSLENKFDNIDWKLSKNGFPIIADTLAWFDCVKWNDYAGGDHKILVGEVTSFDLNDMEPLTFWNGQIS